MMAIVSEKTGYPQEMLELGMDLESDLGIDSIKRVEILGAVQDKIPALPEVPGDELGRNEDPWRNCCASAEQIG